MQMLMDGGKYGGKQYFQEGTITEFTKMQFPLNGNRRGIGFDKPLIEFETDGPNCKSASPSSFGHSGFTGTYMWADPEKGLVYVFLSNRIYPDAWNNKISKLNIRTNLHQVFYDAIEKNENFVGF
jgi:CubicO group peptidase (beta-lactamase class C family)